MGKVKSKRSSLRMGAVIRKKSKAKHERERKVSKMKQYPKRSKKMLVAPQSMPNREEIEAEVHQGSEFVNKVLKPIEGGAPIAKEVYDDQMEQMRKEVLEKHHGKVEAARNSYQSVLDIIESADVIAEVLDARDPTACRFLEAEGETMSKGKKLMFILNKIDLVPREVVIRWAAFLNQTAPVVAINADHSDASAAVQDALSRVAPQATKIALIGLPKTGKSTICAFNPTIFKEIPSFEFAMATPETALLASTIWSLPLYQLACFTLSRLQDESFFSTYGIEVQESPEAVLDELAKKWECKPKEAAKKLMDDLWTKQRWFAVPNDGEWKGITDAQNTALQASLPFDLQIYEYIRLNPGEAIQVDEELLTENLEEEEEEDNNEEEKEEK